MEWVVVMGDVNYGTVVRVAGIGGREMVGEGGESGRERERERERVE